MWQLEIDSELIFVGDAGNTEDTGVGSTRKGLELTIYYQLNERWSLDFEYSWTDSKFKHQVDGEDAIDGSLGEGEQADGSTMVNLRMSYQFNPRLSITADVLNLFDSDDHDVEYFYKSQLSHEIEPVADYHYHIFEPRSLRVYVSYSF